MIFGGTTEGRELSRRLAEGGADVTVSVASDYGSEEQGEQPGVTVLSGRMPVEEMTARLREMDLCVDATHPYAVRVTDSIARACAESATPRLRLLRAGSEYPAGTLLMKSAAEAAEYLADKPGNILLTTGAKELSAWAALPPERLFPRVLPSHESLSACEALGIPHRNICAMQGPFSRAMNEALLRQYEIAWLVTKDGGAPGGFPEKRAAAEALDVPMLVLRRPEEEGEGFETVLAACLERMKEET